MSLLLSRYCTLLLPELQASEDSHDAFILRTWSSMSALSIRYYMSTHERSVVSRKVVFAARSATSHCFEENRTTPAISKRQIRSAVTNNFHRLAKSESNLPVDADRSIRR